MPWVVIARFCGEQKLPLKQSAIFLKLCKRLVPTTCPPPLMSLVETRLVGISTYPYTWSYKTFLGLGVSLSSLPYVLILKWLFQNYQICILIPLPPYPSIFLKQKITDTLVKTPQLNTSDLNNIFQTPWIFWGFQNLNATRLKGEWHFDFENLRNEWCLKNIFQIQWVHCGVSGLNHDWEWHLKSDFWNIPKIDFGIWNTPENQ